MSAKQRINPPAVGQPTGFSHAVRSGNTIYIAGQVARNAQGQTVGPGDIRAQAEQVFANLKTVVEAAGGTLDDFVKITIFTTDIGYRPVIAEVRSRYFKADALPASTLVQIPALADPEFLLEIEAIAEVG
ncbi:MAG TPA: RidA family protein [Dehalococcoidia bacterium]|nr:RidA family protein [Dehalococcoidia bacterium]